MFVTVSLMSKNEGEIKRFLDHYFKKEMDIDNNVIEWIYVYRNAGRALDIMDIAMDNLEDYDISVWIQVEDDDIIEVTGKNRARMTSRILSKVNTAAASF